MNIHIFTSEGSYNQSFIRFFESSFSLDDSLFIFRSKPENKYNYSDNLRKRIAYIDNGYKFIFRLLPRLFSAGKIYIHYLPVGPSLYVFYAFRFLLKKAVWVLWGGDLYYFKYRPKNFRADVYEFLRRGIIKKIPVIACFIKGDYEIAQKVYHTKARYRYVCYPMPTDFPYLAELKKNALRKTGSGGHAKTILVGNSAADTNQHIEILNILSKFKDRDLKVICPLSYAVEDEYVQSVLNCGNRIFGSNFIPLLEMMSPEEYSNLLDSVDVAIMNHQRQQGLGNVLALLYLGKKVYIRKDTTPFGYLSDLGLGIYNTLDLSNATFEEIFSMDELLKASNAAIIDKEFSRENFVAVWKNLFQN